MPPCRTAGSRWGWIVSESEGTEGESVGDEGRVEWERHQAVDDELRAVDVLSAMKVERLPAEMRAAEMRSEVSSNSNVVVHELNTLACGPDIRIRLYNEEVDVCEGVTNQCEVEEADLEAHTFHRVDIDPIIISDNIDRLEIVLDFDENVEEDIYEEEEDEEEEEYEDDATSSEDDDDDDDESDRDNSDTYT
ncbi:histone chaperone ASF1-like [Momordica charantia]|uniref:Histone chaperone ASF1-like n=1 Tax=Momordica charantia TaxID=3673 RepID=A0A6J1CS49_MOMCH|nr:histone chaperone ASF1-like [Momordica charantia]